MMREYEVLKGLKHSARCQEVIWENRAIHQWTGKQLRQWMKEAKWDSLRGQSAQGEWVDIWTPQRSERAVGQMITDAKTCYLLLDKLMLTYDQEVL